MDTTDAPSPERVEEFVIAAHGNLDKVPPLLAATPALLNIPRARFDETALAASHTGNRPIAEHLLARGADPNTPDFAGKTTVRAALDGRHTEIADLLRAHGGLDAASDAA